MTLRDLSFAGLAKIILLVDFLITALLLPVFGIIYLIAPDKVNFNFEPTFRMYGVTVQTPSESFDIYFLILVLMTYFIGLLIKCAVLQLIFQRTPLGSISIGKSLGSDE